MAEKEDSSYALFSNERYAPMYWLHRWTTSNGLGEHEVALGYAHLAYLLSEQFVSGFKAGEPNFIRTGVKAAMASYSFDPQNYAENEFTLYFEGLKLIALRNILTSLTCIGCFQEAKELMEFITTPENWLTTQLSDSERARLVGYHVTVSEQADIAKKKQGGKTYLRYDSKLWKSPYDIDLSTAGGIKRLNQYLFSTRDLINPPVSSEEAPIFKKLRISRGRREDKAPSLITLGVIENGSTVWREAATIGVTSDVYAPLNTCECCLLPEKIHPVDSDSDDDDDGAKSCCAYASERIRGSCHFLAQQTFHTCWNWDKDPVKIRKTNEDLLTTLAFDRKGADFSHAPLLIKRILHGCRKLSQANVNKKLHPLQYDVIPFLRADCERAVPWSYKTGIVEILQTLINEGIDPFTDDDWDIRTILILWRKLGPTDWNTIFQKANTTSLGPLATVTTVHPIFSFLEHSCNPNAQVKVSPIHPLILEIEATRKILPGERITISRIEMDNTKKERLPLKDRQHAFEAMGMKPCQCQYCYEDREKIALAQFKPENPSRFKDADEKQFQERQARQQEAIDSLTTEMKARYPVRYLTKDEKKLTSLKTVQDLYWEEWRKKEAQNQGNNNNAGVGT